MTTPEMRMFNHEFEVDKLKKMLRLPITNVVFDDRYEYGKPYMDDNMNYIIIYAKLFVNDEFVGTIPYSSDRWGPMYYTDKLEIKWDKIYQQFNHIILEKICRQEPLAATAETINDERMYSLSIKDRNGIPIKIAYCDYYDNEWNVSVGGLNPIQRVTLTKVKLYPPPVNLDL